MIRCCCVVGTGILDLGELRSREFCFWRAVRRLRAGRSGFEYSMIASGPSQLAVGVCCRFFFVFFVTRLLLSLSKFVLRAFAVV